MRQHLVKSGLTQETLESILCQKERVSLGKLLEVLKEGKWEIKIVALRRIRRGEEITFDYQKELMNLLDKETMPGIHALNLKSSEDVKRSRRFSYRFVEVCAAYKGKFVVSATSASSSSDVARPMTAPSSSSASSSSRVGRQKTAPSSTSASSFSKAQGRDPMMSLRIRTRSHKTNSMIGGTSPNRRWKQEAADPHSRSSSGYDSSLPCAQNDSSSFR
eukprot:g16976.t1